MLVDEYDVRGSYYAGESGIPEKGGGAEKVKIEKEVPAYPEDRRPSVRQLSGAPQDEINEWVSGTAVKLGELLPTQRDKVTRLLYTYIGSTWECVHMKCSQ